MPTYEYRCNDCNTVFEIVHSIKDDSDYFCSECGENGKEVKMERLISRNVNGFIFKQWTEAQHYKYKRDKVKENKSLGTKQIDRYGTGPRLKPNVAGMEVESWSEAKKVAQEAGLNTSSYEPHIKNEKSTSKISGINDSKWKAAKGTS